MEKLRQLQQQFCDVLTHSTDTHSGDTLPIQESEAFSKKQRAAVYQRAYYIRLSNSFLDDFPETFKLLKNHEEWIRNYLMIYPPRQHSMGECSKNFPQFLLESGMTRHAELALHEWKMIVARAVFAEKPTDLSALGEMAENEILKLKFKLHPSVQLSVMERTTYMIYRSFGEVFVDEIAADNILILQMLLKNLKVEEIISEIQNSEKLFEFFSTLATKGLIINYQTTTGDSLHETNH